MIETAADRSRRLSREAKQRRTGTCENCGAETRYNGRTVTGPSRLCPACANREIGRAHRGHGPTVERVLAFIGDGERGYMEIARGVGLTEGHTGQVLRRLRSYGLVERPSRGRYRVAA